MARAMTRDELAQLTQEVYDATEDILRDCTREEWERGSSWYENASSIASMLRRRTPNRVVSQEMAAGVIAALSPRVAWKHNVSDAERMLMGDLSGFVALGASLVKALRILDGEHPDNVLGGRKVRSFWRNIAYPTTSYDVTIDVWMLRAIVPEKYLASYREPYGFLGRKGVYDAISDGVRRSAEERGMMPHQLQATAWIHVRGSHE